VQRLLFSALLHCTVNWFIASMFPADVPTANPHPTRRERRPCPLDAPDNLVTGQRHVGVAIQYILRMPVTAQAVRNLRWGASIRRRTRKAASR